MFASHTVVNVVGGGGGRKNYVCPCPQVILPTSYGDVSFLARR